MLVSDNLFIFDIPLLYSSKAFSLEPQDCINIHIRGSRISP